jgi:hypothetical protein
MRRHGYGHKNMEWIRVESFFGIWNLENKCLVEVDSENRLRCMITFEIWEEILPIKKSLQFDQEKPSGLSWQSLASILDLLQCHM